MNILDAFKLTCKTLGELQNAGVDVSMVPSLSRFNQITLEKYSGADNLGSELWFHVHLVCDTKVKSDLIRKASKQLSSYGIGFDTGGSSSEYDWEIDWSFRSGMVTEEICTVDSARDDIVKLMDELEDDAK